MTNTKLLWDKIAEAGYRTKFVAKQVGMCYQTLLDKASNKREFTASEIKALCDLLKLSETDRTAIFFAG